MTGKHALITGGSSGIGLAIAHLLWQQGYHLTLIARQRQGLETARDQLQHLAQLESQRILIFNVDVSQPASLHHAIQQASQEISPIDVLVNCAGICTPGHFLEQPLDIFEQTMAVNFYGSLYAARAVLPAMKERGQGQIIFVSSGVGLIGLYGYCSYSPSKFAVRGLAESLRAEMQPYGIHISIVYPPDTDTPQLARENLVKPWVTQKLSETAQVLSAQQVAIATCKGMAAHRFMITPGLEMTLLGRLHSVIAPLLNCYFDRIIAKLLSHKKEEPPSSELP